MSYLWNLNVSSVLIFKLCKETRLLARLHCQTLYNTYVDPCHLIGGLLVTWYSIDVILHGRAFLVICTVHFWLYADCVPLCRARAYPCVYLTWRQSECIKSRRLDSNFNLSLIWGVKHNLLINVLWDLLRCCIKQIMNVFHSFNGANIFIRWKINVNSIQLGWRLVE